MIKGSKTLMFVFFFTVLFSENGFGDSKGSCLFGLHKMFGEHLNFGGKHTADSGPHAQISNIGKGKLRVTGENGTVDIDLKRNSCSSKRDSTAFGSYLGLSVRQRLAQKFGWGDNDFKRNFKMDKKETKMLNFTIKHCKKAWKGFSAGIVEDILKSKVSADEKTEESISR